MHSFSASRHLSSCAGNSQTADDRTADASDADSELLALLALGHERERRLHELALLTCAAYDCKPCVGAEVEHW